MKRIIVLCAMLALGSLSAVPAFAHIGAPWRTAQQAANAVYLGDITWDGVTDTVEYASCRGTGVRSGARFRHFRCYVRTEEASPYWVLVHTGWVANTIDFLYYA